MRERKKVTYKQLKIGQEIKGIKIGYSSSGFSAIVKDINPAFVTVLVWGEREEKITSEDTMFEVEMTDEEIAEKYHEQAKVVLKGIQNTLHSDQIGYHEMWNSWLYAGSIFEIASYTVKEKMKIVGHCKEIHPKTAMFSVDILDIGVCAEYEDGERFWCHYRSSDLARLLKKNKDLLEPVVKEDNLGFDNIFANWDKYCDRARKLLTAAGFQDVIEIRMDRKGFNGNTAHVYIESFPMKGNKEIIERLNKIKGFYGHRMLGHDNRYQYQGYIEIEEV